MEEVPGFEKVCPICSKQMSLFESDFSPEHAEYRHTDKSKGHIIDASYIIKEKPFWKLW